MYDILQLNDMLVPELLDIAEHLDIPAASQLNKQELVYKILDKQALTPTGANGAEKPKRKRTIKASTANTTEEAEVMTDGLKKDKPVKEVKPVLKDKITKETKEEKPKRTRIKLKTADASEEESDDTQDESAGDNATDSFPDVDESLTQMGANLLSMLGDDEPIIYPDEADIVEPVTIRQSSKKEPAFNVEFDGIIQAEGLKDYLKIHLKSSSKPLVARLTMKAMEEQLPSSMFVRVQKSFIVSKDYITSIRKNSVFINDVEIPVGDNYKDAILALTGKY